MGVDPGTGQARPLRRGAAPFVGASCERPTLAFALSGSMIWLLGRHGRDADMPVARRKPRNRSTTRRQAGAFSFGSFIGGVVLGGALVLTITYRFDAAGSGSPTPDTAIEAPVAPHIDWEFVRELPKAEVKTGVAPVEQPRATHTGPREYVLHAAQFLRQDDAQVLQAELMLDGFPVSLTSSPRDNGGAWYRVVVGPYADEPDAQQVLGELRARDIPAQLLARPLPGPAPAA